MKSHITLLVLGLGLMLAPTSVLAGGLEQSMMPMPLSQASYDTKTLLVTGTGKVAVPADKATITFTLQSYPKTYAEGHASFTNTLDSLKTLLAKYGVKPDDIKTTWSGFYPEYDYATETPKINRYNMTRSVSVDFFSNLDNIEALLDVVIGAATTTVNIQDANFSYGLQNGSLSARAARVMAIKDAKEKSEQLASLLGLTLDGLSKVEDYYSYGNYYTSYSKSVDIELSMNFTYKFK